MQGAERCRMLPLHSMACRAAGMRAHLLTLQVDAARVEGGERIRDHGDSDRQQQHRDQVGRALRDGPAHCCMEETQKPLSVTNATSRYLAGQSMHRHTCSIRKPPGAEN